MHYIWYEVHCVRQERNTGSSHENKEEERGFKFPTIFINICLHLGISFK
jgi:hypothetical protein